MENADASKVIKESSARMKNASMIALDEENVKTASVYAKADFSVKTALYKNAPKTARSKDHVIAKLANAHAIKDSSVMIVQKKNVLVVPNTELAIFKLGNVNVRKGISVKHAQIKFARLTVIIMVNVIQMERVNAGMSSWVSTALRKSVGIIATRMVYALMDAVNVNPAFLVNFAK
jgi:hypothetical protein